MTTKPKKRTSLSDFVSRTVEPASAQPPAPPTAVAPPPPPRREKVRGTHQHSVYLPLAAHEQLRKLAFDEHGKMHDYLIEGLDLVFRRKGLPSIAELTTKDGVA